MQGTVVFVPGCQNL